MLSNFAGALTIVSGVLFGVALNAGWGLFLFAKTRLARGVGLGLFMCGLIGLFGVFGWVSGFFG